MDKVASTLLLFAFFLTSPPTLSADENLPRIVLLETLTLKTVQQRSDGLLAEMARMGFADGREVRIERLNAQKDRGRARELLQTALAKGRPDLVITNATLASQEARKMLRGTGIPQMFFGVSDPVRAGLVKAVGKPSGENITGIGHFLPESTVINMVVRMLATGSARRSFRIGVLYSTYPSSVNAFAVMKEVEKSRSDISFIPLRIQQLSLHDGMAKMIKQTLEAIEAAKGKMDYLWFARGPLMVSQKFLLAVFDASPVPIIFGRNLHAVRQGALMTGTSNPLKDGHEAGQMAVRLIKGADVQTMTVGQSDNFVIGINLGTADRMGITVPSDIIELAQGNLFR